LKDIYLPLDVIDELFPTETEEGHNVMPSIAATTLAATALDVPCQDITWHAPDVFDIRYGSSYVATARAGDKAVRFHSNEGDFQEGDDR
jgi:hypothetical protein